MKSRRSAIGTTVAVVVAIAIIAGGTVAFVMYTSLSTSSSSSGLERSGPISTYPASWTDCGAPAHGNTTTDNQIPSQSASMGAPNLTLSQLYSKIVNSPNFTTTSLGHGWVTNYWGLQEDSGPGYSYEYVIAQFVLVFRTTPPVTTRRTTTCRLARLRSTTVPICVVDDSQRPSIAKPPSVLLLRFSPHFRFAMIEGEVRSHSCSCRSIDLYGCPARVLASISRRPGHGPMRLLRELHLLVGQLRPLES